MSGLTQVEPREIGVILRIPGVAMYIRFVICQLNESSGRREGLFQAAARLRDARLLADYELNQLHALQEWFGEHLPRPTRFSRGRRSDHGDAISWFKDAAAGHLARMHELRAILAEHGIITHMITCDRPGYIVYEDDHQVAAVPFAETAT
jgi:hypothetical protein